MNPTETLKRIVELFAAAGSKKTSIDAEDINVDIQLAYLSDLETPVRLQVTENESCLGHTLYAETLEDALHDMLSVAVNLEET